MILLDWAWANIMQISLIVSPAVTVTMWAVRATVPSRALLYREVKAVNTRVDREVKAMEGRLLLAHRRIGKVEANMQALATRDDVSQVLVALERQDGKRQALEAKVDGIHAELASIARPLDLIQEHLLASGRK